jgi:CopG family nickel-responsive transcriptional regulator
MPEETVLRTIALDSNDGLARLSLSMPSSLLTRLDVMVEQRGISNRSQLVSELIRNALDEHAAEVVENVQAGAITIVYRGDSGRTRQRVGEAQSTFLKEVITSQHVFLEDDQSLEVLIVQGSVARLNELCDLLRSIRGVHQIKLTRTAALLPPLTEPTKTKNSTSTAAAK